MGCEPELCNCEFKIWKAKSWFSRLQRYQESVPVKKKHAKLLEPQNVSGTVGEAKTKVEC
jgi:hypothetical protein